MNKKDETLKTPETYETISPASPLIYTMMAKEKRVVSACLRSLFEIKNEERRGGSFIWLRKQPGTFIFSIWILVYFPVDTN